MSIHLETKTVHTGIITNRELVMFISGQNEASLANPSNVWNHAKATVVSMEPNGDIRVIIEMPLG